MDYSQYINNIGYRFCRTHTPPDRFRTISRYLSNLKISLEILNTKLPINGAYMKKTIGELCSMPKMSTYAIGAMINYGVSQLKQDTCFVNVGVWHGFSFLSGILGNPDKQCIGIDNFSEFGGPRKDFLQRFNAYKSQNHNFFDMDYQDYFSKVHTKQIGYYFYDGEHSYENQLNGLRAAEPFFAENCIVMVDDTNWDAPRNATLEFIENSNFTYEIIMDENTVTGGHPCLWNGVLIFQRNA